MRNHKFLRKTSAGVVAALVSSVAIGQVEIYSPPADSYNYYKSVTFNFDGDEPFASNGHHIATLQFNGQTIAGTNITDAGSANNIHIRKTDQVLNNELIKVTEVKLAYNDDKTAGNYRTQINSYPIEPYKQYLVELEFMLHPDWNFSTSKEGLLWQMKGEGHRKDQNDNYLQAPNPSMSLVLTGNQLKFTVNYPEVGWKPSTWPKTLDWGSTGYHPTTFDTATIEAGKYYRVLIIFFADDRPSKLSTGAKRFGNGFVTVFLDDKLLLNHDGPNMTPDLPTGQRHNTSYGWYQYGGQSGDDRIVYFKKNRLFSWE